MRKVVRFLVFLTAACAIAVWLMGCDRRSLPPSDIKTMLYMVHIETVKGHDYIITSSSGGGAVSTVHAEHCKCKGGE